MEISNTNSRSGPVLEAELSRLTHDLMGGISSLLMCEHIITKELEGNPEAKLNSSLQLTMSLMRDTAAQLRDYGERLMDVSHRFQDRANG